MSFSAEWLALREPADHAARDPDLLTEACRRASAVSPAPAVIDLGAGTGSNLRAMQPHLSPTTRWRLVDNDPALLDVARASAPQAEFMATDLAAISFDALKSLLSGADLVTAAALFDLVSIDWLDRFVGALPRTAVVYAALSYDGREAWAPSHMDDDAVLSAFLSHMRTDKGFGPALGPDAAPALAELLQRAGFAVTIAQSDWRLSGETSGPLIDALCDGVAGAATEMGADARAWRDAERIAVEIGHLDILATPPL